MSRFRIHPAIGIARVGDSPTESFVGPEEPGIPGNWINGNFDSFRDTNKLIKRQAARFHVFEYFDDGRPPKEVFIGDAVKDIEWRVHIANKKASFFTFNGQSGNETDPAYANRELPNRKPDSVEKEKGEGQPLRLNKRNAAVTDRTSLEIDPGEQTISKKDAGDSVILKNPNKSVPVIGDLGELRIDQNGRLQVLGGHGVTQSTASQSPKIDEYANNDTWFDDVGDGTVKARIWLDDKNFEDADAAWVLVGPPKFAPGIGNAVRLYDTLWDIAVRSLKIPDANPIYRRKPLLDMVNQQDAWGKNKGASLEGYKPSFTREIYPILKRALGARDVHAPGEINRSYHLQLLDYPLMARPNTEEEKDTGRELREMIFYKWIRNPRSTTLKTDDWRLMPRGLGDDYTALDDYENQKRDNPLPTSFLSLTQIQFALLEQWAKGNFDSDWEGEPTIPTPAELTPEGLDQAALENCVGGPFYPGIEISWLVRQVKLYSEPFRFVIPKGPDSDKEPRLKIGTLELGPGFFSQQMALPWQADFYDCHKEEHTTPDQKNYLYMWWTAQRPDDVYPSGESEQKRWVRQFDAASTSEDPDDLDNLERYEQMRVNWSKLKFLVPAPPDANHNFEEEP